MSIRYALARKEAAGLLSRNKIVAPAVPVEDLAVAAGATLRYEPYEGELSGMVHSPASGRAVIGVNSLHSANRRRFTIAHEIGHLLLHVDQEFHVDERVPVWFRAGASNTVEPTEVEANFFAAELLMPTEFLERDLGGRPFDRSEDEIEDLARRYEVSVQAMTIRLSSLRSK